MKIAQLYPFIIKTACAARQEQLISGRLVVFANKILLPVKALILLSDSKAQFHKGFNYQLNIHATVDNLSRAQRFEQYPIKKEINKLYYLKIRS